MSTEVFALVIDGDDHNAAATAIPFRMFQVLQ
jgi:hypothetical protein